MTEDQGAGHGRAAGAVVVPVSAVQIAELLRKDPPTAEQVAVIEAPLRPSLVVAGAGSGKTETMAGRVVWLLANGLVAPHEVLGLTFTRKAAGELEQRVVGRLRAVVRAAARERVTLPGADTLRASGRDDDPLAGLDRPTVSTYNAYAASLVVDHALRLGLEPGTRLLGEAAQFQLAAQVVEGWTEDLATDKAISTVIDAVIRLSGALDEHLLDPARAQALVAGIVADLRATPGVLKSAAREVVASLEERSRVLDLVAAYRRRKRELDAIDFGDQVALAARVAREAPQVGAAERERFRVVLLDEYQDTSFAQLELLRALFGGGHPVTAVGDPHQSIYGWRGASAGGLARFPTAFGRPGPGGSHEPADVHQLSTSWRNDRRILEVANQVAGPLRTAQDARGGPVRVPELVARPSAGEGHVDAAVLETVDDEAALVATFVGEHWRPASGPGGAGRVTAAVLCRKRSQFETLHRALVAAGLPVEVVGLGGLLATPEVVDLVALLQAAHDASRGDALLRLLTGARTRLGAADLHALHAWAMHLAGGRVAATGAGDGDVVEPDGVDAASIVDAVDDLPPAGWRGRDGRSLSDEARRRLVDLAGVLRAVRTHTYLPLPELVAHAERLLDLDIEVAARAGAEPARARAHLDAFADVAAEFARTAEQPTLGAFLAWLDAADAQEDGLELPVTEPDPDAVQLATIHGAKGLEWDVVAIPGLVDGVLPARAAGAQGYTDSAWLTGLGTLPYPLRGDRDDLPAFAFAGAADGGDLEARRRRFVADSGAHELAEERRLAYVAITRARSRVLLTGARWTGGSTPRAVSPFLAELAEAGFVDPSRWAPEPARGATDPRAERVSSLRWPADPFGPGAVRRPALERSAAAVRRALAEGETGSGGGAGGGAGGGGVAAVVGALPSSARSPWDDLADRLLAERAAVSAGDRSVALPTQLSASALVRLDADPVEFARSLRRPVPGAPSPAARRGTAFHAWVEGFYGAATLVDIDALPGADDDSVPVDGDLRRLQEAFARTPWANRTPLAVEVDVETSVDGYVLRSRIDAVFADDDRPDVPGGVVVVDWKTGAPPEGEAARSARELQLAVYRLAWSRWAGVPLEAVRAAFCYVGVASTVFPDRLLDADEIAGLLRRVTGESAPDAGAAFRVRP